MNDHSRDMEHLAEADRHIAEAEERARHLQQQIDKRSNRGEDVSSSQELLTIIRAAIITMRAHRNAIRSGLGYAKEPGND